MEHCHRKKKDNSGFCRCTNLLFEKTEHYSRNSALPAIPPPQLFVHIMYDNIYSIIKNFREKPGNKANWLLCRASCGG